MLGKRTIFLATYTIQIYRFSVFRGVKLTFYSKSLNDLTILDSFLLKKYHSHPLYNTSNLSTTPLFFLLTGDQDHDALSKQCNETFRKIKSGFENLRTLSSKDGNLEYNVKSLLKEIRNFGSQTEIQKNLPLIIEKNPFLHPFLKIFKEIKGDVFSLVSTFQNLDLKDKKNAFIHNLAGVTNICIFLNIIDLEIWQKVVNLTVNKVEIMNERESFHVITSNILEVLNLFRFRFNDTTLTFPNLFYYDEKEMISIINKNYFWKIFQKIEEAFRANFQNPQGQIIDELCSNYNQICLLAFKFLRVQSLDFHFIRTFTENLKKIIINDIEKLSIKNSLILYKNFGNFGYNDTFLMKKFENHFMNNLEIFGKEDEKIALGSLLSNWRSNGEYNPLLYEAYMRPRLIKMINSGNSRRLSSLSSLFYDLVCTKVADFEIIGQILECFSKIEIDSLPIFNKKAIHSAIQSLLTWKDAKLDLKLHQTLIDKLSIFCINQNYNQMSSDIKKEQSNSSPLFKELNLIDCCKTANLTKFKNKNIKSTNVKDNDQKNNPSFQEKKILSVIKDYFIPNVQEKLEFYWDYQVCVYKIDIALFFEKNREKVALEICGKPYGLENGNFQGKKQMKFQLLQNVGWKIIYLDISDGKYFNMLAKFNERVAAEFGKEIQCKIEEVLGRKLELKQKKKESLEKNNKIFNFKPDPKKK